jgi:hypothetical protein
MQRITRFALLASLLLTSACAHQIAISPPERAIAVSGSNLTKIGKSVGFYISQAERGKAVTTSAGLGNIKYQPYKDLEQGFERVLSNLFTKVVVLQSPDDKNAIVQHGLAYVFVPTITTNSSSQKHAVILNSQDANFSVVIDCKALGPAGNTVWQAKVQGRGGQDYRQTDDVKTAFSSAATSASKHALLELQKEINGTAFFHQIELQQEAKGTTRYLQ